MAEKTETTRVKLAHGATPVNEGGVVNIGVHTVTLPGVGTQKEGFDLPTKDAKRLLSQFPDRYKRMGTTGQSQQAQQQDGQQGEGQSSDDIRDADATDDVKDDANVEGHEEEEEDATDDSEGHSEPPLTNAPPNNANLRDGQMLAELTAHDEEEGHDDAETD